MTRHLRAFLDPPFLATLAFAAGGVWLLWQINRPQPDERHDEWAAWRELDV